MRTGHLVPAVAFAVLGSSLVVSSVSAQTPPSPGVVRSPSAAEARHVIADYNRANQTNNDTLDIEGQGAVESPPIQLIDDATFREVRGRGDTSLHEKTKVDQVRVYVPTSSSYPLQFLATERTTTGGDHLRQLLVFVKASETDPWRVSMAAQASAHPALPKPLRGSDGAATLLDADHAASLLATPASLPQSLADLWARAAGEERAPNKDFVDGTLTSGMVDRLVNELALLGINALVDFGFEPAPFPVVAFRAVGGGAVCLFAVAVHETITPNTGDDRLLQPKSRDTFTGLVVPGEYRAVRFDRVAIAAVKVPDRGSHDKIDVIGFYDGATAAVADGIAIGAPVALQ